MGDDDDRCLCVSCERECGRALSKRIVARSTLNVRGKVQIICSSVGIRKRAAGAPFEAPPRLRNDGVACCYDDRYLSVVRKHARDGHYLRAVVV